MIINKKLGSKGTVTIPQQLRHAMGYQPGIPLDIEDAGDSLLIHKHVPTCNLCGSVVDVVTVQSMEICAECARALAAAAEKKLGAQRDGK